MTTRPKTGGRKRGSIDREARKVLTDRMAGDLMTVYGRLGGVDWLLEFAKANPAEFIKSGLSRLWPAPARDDADVQVNTQINIGDTFEAARRVAFLLNSAMHPDPSLVAEQDISPQEALNKWHPAPEPEPLLKPEPVEDPERERWASELPLSAEERADQALIRQTKESTLMNYHGGCAEQGGTVQRSASGRKPTVSEIHQRMRSRRDELL